MSTTDRLDELRAELRAEIRDAGQRKAAAKLAEHAANDDLAALADRSKGLIPRDEFAELAGVSRQTVHGLKTWRDRKAQG